MKKTKDNNRRSLQRMVRPFDNHLLTLLFACQGGYRTCRKTLELIEDLIERRNKQP